MVLNRQDKQAIIAEVSEVAKGASSVVIADFRGIVANKMTDLRKSAREAGVCLRVVRNTLIHRVVRGTPHECLKEVFTGPTLIAFSKEKAGIAARLFKEFAKENPVFKIKGATFEGEYIPENQIDRLANLPTYREAIARLMLTIKEASVGKLVRIMAALRDQKRLLSQAPHSDFII